MSFVLDALRKSEQERQLASGQGASMLYPVIVEQEQRSWWESWRGLLAAGFVLLVATVIAGLWWRSLPSNGGASSPNSLPTLSAVAQVPPSPPVSPPAQQVVQAQAASPLLSNPKQRTAESIAAPAKPPPPTIQATETVPLKTIVKKGEGPNQVVLPPGKSSSPPVPKPSLAVEPVSTIGNPPDDLPPLVIAGYIGDPDGGNLAMINDKLVHEGAEVSPGLRLEKILSDGYIFSYKGKKFRK